MLTPPALYSQYFENEMHPSQEKTLLAAARDAGVPETSARMVVEDKNDGLRDVQLLIREQIGNSVDSVPNITFEGKKRDLTLVGAKEVAEYTKALEQIAKESR